MKELFSTLTGKRKLGRDCTSYHLSNLAYRTAGWWKYLPPVYKDVKCQNSLAKYLINIFNIHWHIIFIDIWILQSTISPSKINYSFNPSSSKTINYIVVAIFFIFWLLYFDSQTKCSFLLRKNTFNTHQ